ncbi:hypothetical protein JHK82_031553 [Glycine max]|nr:hypothetical protein JHK85_032206 [Glycine max]KAG5124816.1 hypothetical protein JHK82_031553 [Glycine max]KAG5146236.1 hypothetical protein JHK84_031779 [Glycine max]
MATIASFGAATSFASEDFFGHKTLVSDQQIAYCDVGATMSEDFIPNVPELAAHKAERKMPTLVYFYDQNNFQRITTTLVLTCDNDRRQRTEVQHEGDTLSTNYKLQTEWVDD